MPKYIRLLFSVLHEIYSGHEGNFNWDLITRKLHEKYPKQEEWKCPKSTRFCSPRSEFIPSLGDLLPQ